MEIKTFRHRDLKRLYSGGLHKLDSRWVDRIDAIFDVIEAADDPDSLRGLFGFHALAGNRKGEYAMTVTKNWRLTFRIDETGAAVGLNLEDYH